MTGGVKEGMSEWDALWLQPQPLPPSRTEVRDSHKTWPHPLYVA
jgi:hypothetical protein